MEKFNIINDRLGKGSFGKAKLVERKSDKKRFVVKEVARGITNKEKAEEAKAALEGAGATVSLA